MPWSPSDAPSHTKKANTPAKKKKWARVANAALKTYAGDDDAEGKAVRTANSAMDDAFWDGILFDDDGWSKEAKEAAELQKKAEKKKMESPEYHISQLVALQGKMRSEPDNYQHVLQSQSHIRALRGQGKGEEAKEVINSTDALILDVGWTEEAREAARLARSRKAGRDRTRSKGRPSSQSEAAFRARSQQEEGGVAGRYARMMASQTRGEAEARGQEWMANVLEKRTRKDSVPRKRFPTLDDDIADKLKIPIYGPKGRVEFIYEEEEDEGRDERNNIFRSFHPFDSSMDVDVVMETPSIIGDADYHPSVFFDAVEIDDAAKLHYTEDGYLAAMPRVARTGIQVYHGIECGRPDLSSVRVYRPESAVFSKDALHSFAHRPVTIEHPGEKVDANNWRNYAVGHTGDEVLRDGNNIRVPMVLMDHAAVEAFKAGKNQLSVGYTCDLDWTPGKTEDGESYDAIQKTIRANHLAVVAAARGGPTLKIGDGKGDDTMNLKTVMVDGISCQMEDTAAAIVMKTLTSLQDTIKAMQDADKKRRKDEEDDDDEYEDAIKKLNDAVKAKDAEITTLKTQLKDAEMTPEKLDTMVKDRQIVIDKAKAVLGDSKLKTEGVSLADIQKQVVSAKLGDAAKDWDANQIAASFNTLVAASPTSKSPPSGFQRGVNAFSRDHSMQDDKQKAYEDANREAENAWRGEQKKVG